MSQCGIFDKLQGVSKWVNHSLHISSLLELKLRRKQTNKIVKNQCYFKICPNISQLIFLFKSDSIMEHTALKIPVLYLIALLLYNITEKQNHTAAIHVWTTKTERTQDFLLQCI